MLSRKFQGYFSFREVFRGLRRIFKGASRGFKAIQDVLCGFRRFQRDLVVVSGSFGMLSRRFEGFRGATIGSKAFRDV